MRVSRTEFLRVLESVSPGLSPREVTEQSSCFVFDQGRVLTFNDEVCASRVSPVPDLVGAVSAKPLMLLLDKLPEDEIDITAGDGEVYVKGTGRRAGITMENEIRSAGGSVEKPGDWKPLDPDFGAAVGVVADCCSRNEEMFVLTCVHIAPDFLEACDNSQVIRYPIKTDVGQDVLIRQASLRSIRGLDMTEFSETEGWFHFRNPAGLVISCRRWVDTYPDLSDFMVDEEAKPLTLPAGLAEAVGKAEVFSSLNSETPNVVVDIQPGKLLLEGRGAVGWYQEKKTIVYNGRPLRFSIAPKLLVDVLKRSNDCKISASRLIVETGKYRFVSCLAEVG